MHTPPKQRCKTAMVAGIRGCTLADLADKLRLPIDQLRAEGLSDFHYENAPAVRIPYRDKAGAEVAVKYRVALDKSEERDRFKWKAKARPTLYGWQRLAEAREGGYIFIVEGVSDALTLWHYGFPALGLPSATGWKEDYASTLDGIDTVFVVIEPDEGGQTVRNAFKSSRLAVTVRLIYMPLDAKDPNELHMRDPDSFLHSFNRLLAEAVPLSQELRLEASEAAAVAWQECQSLIQPRILDRFADSVRNRGVAGEEKLTKILYLALCSRYLSRPVSVAVKGPSSGGKSYIVEQTLAYFPPERILHALRNE